MCEDHTGRHREVARIGVCLCSLFHVLLHVPEQCLLLGIVRVDIRSLAQISSHLDWRWFHEEQERNTAFADLPEIG